MVSIGYTMVQKIIDKTAFSLYAAVWSLVMPLLKLNRRLAEGYAQRRFRAPLPGPVDVWIQAASVGESYLAWELLKRLEPVEPVGILLTTNTLQGMEILQKAIQEITPQKSSINASAAFFPFDKPGIMRRAAARLDPAVMILLESEMWPGHLRALKEAGCPTLIVNGRMTGRSLKGYLLWPSLWRRLRPAHVLAISEDDARRFGRLFGAERVDVMHNIKFDRLSFDSPDLEEENPLGDLFPPQAPILVLGSVRREEEVPVRHMIQEILQRHPNTVVALFPRHLHRQKSWMTFFDSHRIAWQLRSTIRKAVPPGSVILWDTFGELSQAYRLSSAAFVGGTLAPLGGQNFLEPLTSGVRPVIGPSWENFHWVGQDIVDCGLVRITAGWQEAAEVLSGDIEHPQPAAEVREAARKYIARRQGGTAAACALIEGHLHRRSPGKS